MGLEKDSRSDLTRGGTHDRPKPLSDPATETTLFGIDRVSTIHQINRLLPSDIPGDTRQETGPKELSEVDQTTTVLHQSWLKGQSVFFGVMRDGAVRMLAGGNALVKEDGKVKQPPGAKGTAISPAVLEGNLGDETKYNAWKHIALEYTPPPASKQGDAKGFDGQLSLEKSLLPYFDGDFAYIGRARPISTTEIQDRSDDLKYEWEDAVGNKESNLDARKKTSEFEIKHDHLDEAKKWGYWRVDLLAGAKSEEDVIDVTTSIAAGITSDEFTAIPQPVEGSYPSLPDALAESELQGSEVSTAALAKMFSILQHEHTGFGQVVRPRFDVRLEGAENIPEGKEINLGTIYDDYDNLSKDNRLKFDQEIFKKHMLIAGASGEGKSELLRKLAEQLDKNDIKITLITPAEDHRVLGDRLANPVSLIVPGHPTDVPAGWNIFEPEPGYPLESHVDHAIDLLLNAFGGKPGEDDSESSETTRRYLSDAIWGNPEKGFEGIYKKLGWSIQRGKTSFKASFPDGHTPQYPNMEDMMYDIGEAVGILNFEGDASNLQEGLKSRIRGLRQGKKEQLFEGYTYSTEAILNNHTVIETSHLTDSVDQSLFIGSFLVRTLENLKAKYGERDDGLDLPLTNVIMIDEAHLYLKEGPLADKIADMIAKVRKYGVGIIFADQTPEALSKQARASAGTVVATKAREEDNVKVMGKAIGLTDAQSRFMRALQVGDVMMVGGQMDYAVYARIDDPRGLPGRLNQTIEATDLIEPRYGEKLYGKDVIVDAREFLDTDDGRLLTGWADLSVQVGSMFKHVAVLPDEAYCERNGITYFENLKTMGNNPELTPEQNDHNRDVRDRAIMDIVTKTIGSRGGMILKNYTREQTIDLYAQRLQAQLEGTYTPDEPVVNNVLDAYATSETKASIYEHYARTNAQRREQLNRARQGLANLADIEETDPGKAMQLEEIKGRFTNDITQLERALTDPSYAPIGRLPDSDPEIKGETALEQIGFLSRNHGSMKDILLGPYRNASGDYFIDHLMGSSVNAQIITDQTATKERMEERQRRLPELVNAELRASTANQTAQQQLMEAKITKMKLMQESTTGQSLHEDFDALLADANEYADRARLAAQEATLERQIAEQPMARVTDARRGWIQNYGQFLNYFDLPSEVRTFLIQETADIIYDPRLME